MRTIEDLYCDLRASANRLIKSRSKHTGGSNYMKDRLIIRDMNSVVISESSIAATVTELGKRLGFAEIAEAGIPVFTHYSLVTDNPVGTRYAKARGEWYVISNCPVAVVACGLNDLFDKLNVRLIADVVDR